MAGFGPTNAGVKVLCLTAWRHPIIITVIFYHIGGFVSSEKAELFSFRRAIGTAKGKCVISYHQVQPVYPPPRTGAL